MPETATLGSGAYQSLLSSYTGAGNAVGTDEQNQAFNNWAGKLTERFDVKSGLWEDLPANWESRVSEPPSFTNAINDFSSLLTGFSGGGADVNAPVSDALNLGTSPTTPPPNNGSMLGTPGTQPTQQTSSGTAVSDLLSSLLQQKDSPTIYTVSPTSVTSTTATYNVNQNPTDTLTPVLQAQSGFFAGLMRSFDTLVSKVTTTSRLEPNPNNGAITNEINYQRPMAFLSPIADRSLPNAPSATAATVSGIFPRSSTNTVTNQIPWGMISALVGVASLILFLVFRKRRG